jgi:hypothetical protein
MYSGACPASLAIFCFQNVGAQFEGEEEGGDGTRDP